MTDPDVRPATLEDGPAIRGVARRAWEAAYEDILGTDVIDAGLERWYDPEPLRDHVTADAPALVAVRDSVVGFAFGSTEDEPAELVGLYVDPDCWREGVGSALLAAVEDRLRDRGRDRLVLATFTDNDRARAFYRAHGYEPVADDEVPVGDGETAEVRRFAGDL